MIHWPVIICFHGDADLVYVQDQAEWEDDPHLQRQPYHPEDRMIDAKGNSFSLRRNEGKVIPEATGITFDLDEVLELVRHHTAQDGACCVAKIGASSIKEAIKLVS